MSISVSPDPHPFDALFVGLLSPAGVLLDGSDGRTGPDDGRQGRGRLREAPWWSWSLTVGPVVTGSAVTGVRCSVLAPGDATGRSDAGRCRSADGTAPAAEQSWRPR